MEAQLTATTEPERSRHYAQVDSGRWPDHALLIRAVEIPAALTEPEILQFLDDCDTVGLAPLPGHFPGYA